MRVSYLPQKYLPINIYPKIECWCRGIFSTFILVVISRVSDEVKCLMRAATVPIAIPARDLENAALKTLYITYNIYIFVFRSRSSFCVTGNVVVFRGAAHSRPWVSWEMHKAFNNSRKTALAPRSIENATKYFSTRAKNKYHSMPF